MSFDITIEDIVWWEEFLRFQQQSSRTSNYVPLVEHILKLAKAVKQIQANERND